jgi:hypothetical protein
MMRGGHVAALLANGKVLIAGGWTFGDYTPEAEIYDPATGTWTKTVKMSRARVLHSAVTLADGRVLVAGGTDTAGAVAAAELFDPASGTWSVTGSLATPRELAQLVLLGDGSVLLVGGQLVFPASDLVGTTEVYNPATGAWTTAASLGTKRKSDTVTALSSGQVLIAGGEDLNSSSPTSIYASTEIFTWPPALKAATQASIVVNNIFNSGSIYSSPPGLSCTSMNGSLSGACTASFPIGATVQLHVNTLMGDEFGGWGDACASFWDNDPCTLTVDHDKAVSASFYFD